MPMHTSGYRLAPSCMMRFAAKRKRGRPAPPKPLSGRCDPVLSAADIGAAFRTVKNLLIVQTSQKVMDAAHGGICILRVVTRPVVIRGRPDQGPGQLTFRAAQRLLDQ